MPLMFKFTPRLIILIMQKQEIQGNPKKDDNPTQKEQFLNSYSDFFFSGKLKTLVKFQIGKFQSICIFATNLFHIVLLFLTCLVITSPDLQDMLKFDIFPATESQIIYRIIQGAIIILKIFLIQVILVELTYSQTKSTFEKFNMKIISHVLLISEIDLVISAGLLIINNQENAFNFFLSSAFRIFIAIYLQNYIIRKDYLYLTSELVNILYRGFYIIGSMLNSIVILTTNTNQSLALLFGYTVIFWAWIFFCGGKLYHHHFTKHLMLVISSSLGMITYLIIEQLIQETPFFAVTVLSKYILLQAILLIFLKISMNSKINSFDDKFGEGDKQTVKEADLLVSSVYEASQYDKDMQALLLGLFSMHQQKCSNSICSFHLKAIYDPILMTEVSVVGELRSKQSSLRFYLNCLYETILIEKSKNDKNQLINYCEFLYTEFSNSFKMGVLLIKMQDLDLNIFDRLKMQRMRLALKQQTESLNHRLYKGKLHLQNVIQSQSIIEQINNNIREYLSKNIGIWKQIGGNEVSMAKIFQPISQNFQLIERINKKWKKLLMYLELNRYWKFIYSNYAYFILNERIKLKSFFGSQKEESQTALGLKIFKCQRDLDNVDQSLLFDKQTMYISAVLVNKEIMINNMSKNCNKFLENDNSYFIGNEMNVLLPPEIKSTHTNTVLNFLQKGYLSNQDAYRAHLTQCQVGDNRYISVVRFYKFYITDSNTLELVALLKFNQQLPYSTQSTQINSELKETHTLRLKDFNQRSRQKEEQHTLPQNGNIFLKEEGFMPCSDLAELNYIKYVIRIFTFVIVSSIIMLIILTRADSLRVINYSDQYINFMNLYRYPFALGINYFKYYLSIGPKAPTKSKINLYTQSMQELESQSSTIQTIFDQTINTPNSYRPFMNNSINQGLSYNQIDLFYAVYSNLVALNNLPFQPRSYDFMQLNSYIKPGYDNLMNTTKENFHSSFTQIFYQIQMDQVSVAVAQISVFIIAIIFSLYKIRVFHNKMKEVMEILIETSPTDIAKIMGYYEKISVLFFKFQLQISALTRQESTKRQERHLEALQETKSITEQRQGSAFLNNKAKQITQSKQQKTKIRKIYLFIILTMLGIISAVTSIEILAYVSVQDLKIFEQAGFYFIQYFPAAGTICYGLMQKYISVFYPNQITFDPTRYADTLSTLQINSKLPYIGDLVDTTSLYYLKQKNYFYGNPCEYNPSIAASINNTVQQCMNLANQSFTEGLSGFLRFAYKTAGAYMRGETNMSAADLQGFSAGSNTYTLYVIDAINTWKVQFQQKIDAIQNTNSYISIGIAFSIVFVHILLYQCLLMNQLTKKFKFISKIYTNFMPEHVIIREKIIAQKFIQMNFFRQSQN